MLLDEGERHLGISAKMPIAYGMARPSPNRWWHAAALEDWRDRNGKEFGRHTRYRLRQKSCSLMDLDPAGTVVLRRCTRRETTVGLTAKLSAFVIAMEACCGAHHLGRLLVYFIGRR
ncbi:hypothetical protein [Methylobacterium mesophilicum]|uniref:hypothetical protein n=1 Tax=Methylobacterium mesophilicum TaxID=39956 RepID=UPI003F683DF9